MSDDVIQLFGAILVLLPFAWAQLGSLDPYGIPYLTFNLAGSAILAVLALLHQQWGFLLLEGVWAITSAWRLAQVGKRRTA